MEIVYRIVNYGDSNIKLKGEKTEFFFGGYKAENQSGLGMSKNMIIDSGGGMKSFVYDVMINSCDLLREYEVKANFKVKDLSSSISYACEFLSSPRTSTQVSKTHCVNFCHF